MGMDIPARPFEPSYASSTATADHPGPSSYHTYGPPEVVPRPSFDITSAMNELEEEIDRTTKEFHAAEAEARVRTVAKRTRRGTRYDERPREQEEVDSTKTQSSSMGRRMNEKTTEEIVVHREVQRQRQRVTRMAKKARD